MPSKEVTPEQIKAWRLELNKTPEEMAKILDVTVTEFGSWERGEKRPPHPSMLRLAFERLLIEQTTLRIKNDETRFRSMLKEIDDNLLKSNRPRVRARRRANNQI